MTLTLAGLSSTVQGQLYTDDKEADAKTVELRTAIDRGETSNPYVQEVLTVLTGIAKAVGFALPTEGRVPSHLRAAIDDLVATVETPTPTPATPALTGA